jgi:hypothetical protein
MLITPAYPLHHSMAPGTHAIASHGIASHQKEKRREEDDNSTILNTGSQHPFILSP